MGPVVGRGAPTAVPPQEGARTTRSTCSVSPEGPDTATTSAGSQPAFRLHFVPGPRIPCPSLEALPGPSPGLVSGDRDPDRPGCGCGRTGAAGEAGPRGPLADPAEVAGLLRAPRAWEREYPHLPAPSRTPEPGEGHRKREFKGHGWLRQTGSGVWLAGGGLAGWLGRRRPPLGCPRVP